MNIKNFWGLSKESPGAFQRQGSRSSERVEKMSQKKSSSVSEQIVLFSGPILRDTTRVSQRYPPIVRYGVLVSQHGQLGAIQGVSCTGPLSQGRPKYNHDHTFPNSFASDVPSKLHLMVHQMKNLCVFSVFHRIEGAFGAASRGTPK